MNLLPTQPASLSAEPSRLTVRPDDRFGWTRVVAPTDPLLEAARAIPGVTLTPDGRGDWLVPWNAVVARPDLFAFELGEEQDDDVPASGPDVWAQFPRLAVLRPYQRDAIEFARQRPGCYLAFSMGTGKSVTAAAAIALDRLKPVLVVGPLISRGTWCGRTSEPTRWLGIDVVPLEGRLRAGQDPPASPSGWYFCHFDILEAWQPWILLHLQPQALIIDEAQYVKGRDASRTKALRSIPKLRSVRRRIALSGTPIENRVEEIWSQLDCVEPDGWGSHFAFMQRYGDPVMEEGRWAYRGVSNPSELRARLASTSIQKSRQEVLPDLPAITRQRIETQLDDHTRERYDTIEHDVRGLLAREGHELARGVRGERLVQLTLLLETLAYGKTAGTLALIKQALGANEKVVVFSWFKRPLARLARALGSTDAPLLVVTGDMPVDRRLETARTFADGSGPPVFLATIASAGISLNELVAARTVVFNDLWWTPGRILQAEARVWRDRQDRGVLAYYVCADRTVDDLLIDILSRKATEIEMATGVQDAASLIQTVGRVDEARDDLGRFVEGLGALLAGERAA